MGSGRDVVAIACDESGFVGGSLFGSSRVFTHASVHLEVESAADLTDEVRRRLGAGAWELKASRLNRRWAGPVAAWLVGPDGPLAGRAVVHLTDTRLFGLARLAQVVLSDASPEGWWSPREEPETWARALDLDAVLADLSKPSERDVLLAARDLLWIRRRRRLGATVDAWVEVVRAAAAELPDEPGSFLAGWAGPEAVGRARAYVAAPPASPLSEPLLPALRWTIRRWSALGDVDVVHDEQSVLTPARVAAIADELTTSCPGRRLAGFSRVDSRDDARVQLADLVAGVVRRVVEDRLAGIQATTAVDVEHLVAGDTHLLQEGQSSSRKNTSQSRISSGTS
jgi:hypothetical protein